MPDIVLMIDVWVVLGHAAADGHMTVCCRKDIFAILAVLSLHFQISSSPHESPPKYSDKALRLAWARRYASDS